MVGNAALIRELFIAASDGPESDDEQTGNRDQFKQTTSGWPPTRPPFVFFNIPVQAIIARTHGAEPWHSSVSMKLNRVSVQAVWVRSISPVTRRQGAPVFRTGCIMQSPVQTRPDVPRLFIFQSFVSTEESGADPA